MTKKRVIRLISRWKLREGVRMILTKAIAENGQLITEHWSSDFRWVEHDMGLTSKWKHHKYTEFYPEGYTLKWEKHENNADEVTIEDGRSLYVITSENHGEHIAVTTSYERAMEIVHDELLADGLERNEVDEMIEENDFGSWYALESAIFTI